jgi:hypothetical protein
VADSAQRLSPVTVNLLPGQDVLTVPSMRAKIEALMRGLGCGFVPEPLARALSTPAAWWSSRRQRTRRCGRLHYAWRAPPRGAKGKRRRLGLALQWWLQQLDSPATRGRCWSGTPGLPGPGADWAAATGYRAASRRRPPGRCMPARWWPRWPAGWTPAPTAGAGWCASRTSTGRAACPGGPS